MGIGIPYFHTVPCQTAKQLLKNSWLSSILAASTWRRMCRASPKALWARLAQLDPGCAWSWSQRSCQRSQRISCFFSENSVICFFSMLCFLDQSKSSMNYIHNFRSWSYRCTCLETQRTSTVHNPFAQLDLWSGNCKLFKTILRKWW